MPEVKQDDILKEAGVSIIRDRLSRFNFDWKKLITGRFYQLPEIRRTYPRTEEFMSICRFGRPPGPHR